MGHLLKSAFGMAWHADTTADRLTDQGRIDPVILVGIANTPARLDEYADVSRKVARDLFLDKNLNLAVIGPYKGTQAGNFKRLLTL